MVAGGIDGSADSAGCAALQLNRGGSGDVRGHGGMAPYALLPLDHKFLTAATGVLSAGSRSLMVKCAPARSAAAVIAVGKQLRW